MNIFEAIKAYIPYNDQERFDKNNMLDLMAKYDDIFYRENMVAHMTSSAWVTNKNHDKILMAYHNIYKAWAWLGGHCDGEQNCLEVALREVKEESGVKNVKVVSDEIFSLEVLSVDSHFRKGQYVPTHIHLNVTYLLEADENDELFIKQDENSGVAWFKLEEVYDKVDEEWFKENIYRKLNEKLRTYYENN